MAKRIVLVSPEAPPPAAGPVATPRVASAGRLRLGLLDNSKANAEMLLRLIADGVAGSVDVAGVVARHKPHPTYPVGEDVMADLAQEADVVVTAMAD